MKEIYRVWICVILAYQWVYSRLCMVAKVPKYLCLRAKLVLRDKAVLTITLELRLKMPSVVSLSRGTWLLLCLLDAAWEWKSLCLHLCVRCKLSRVPPKVMRERNRVMWSERGQRNTDGSATDLSEIGGARFFSNILQCSNMFSVIITCNPIRETEIESWGCGTWIFQRETLNKKFFYPDT